MKNIKETKSQQNSEQNSTRKCFHEIISTKKECVNIVYSNNCALV